MEASRGLFICKGETKDIYPLTVDGLPYLHDMKGVGENVSGEIYKVDDLRLLDQLEGHPMFYRRSLIDIKIDSNSLRLAEWIEEEAIRRRDDTEFLSNWRGEPMLQEDLWYHFDHYLFEKDITLPESQDEVLPCWAYFIQNSSLQTLDDFEGVKMHKSFHEAREYQNQ